MKGRKPIPSALKLLRGNPGRRPVNPEEPRPDPLTEGVPKELAGKVARAEWRRGIIPAIRRRQITADDRSLAIAHCELFETWRSQLALAAQSPHVIEIGRNKILRPHPAREAAHRSFKLLLAIDVELGITPSARSRVKITPPEPRSKWADLR